MVTVMGSRGTFVGMGSDGSLHELRRSHHRDADSDSMAGGLRHDDCHDGSIKDPARVP